MARMSTVATSKAAASAAVEAAASEAAATVASAAVASQAAASAAMLMDTMTKLMAAVERAALWKEETLEDFIVFNIEQMMSITAMDDTQMMIVKIMMTNQS